ncbi:hypothetical protein GYA27_02890 [candidate division WWE3 bacterium]|uniref:Uncharacterized protein n=1 Tax=candidate division WWE3 bacterium TaxID=2053526 RepID=A0A7X9DKJ1_UNCKA|nr:hypothetical protein [candidate division WWE3 bacterium]
MAKETGRKSQYKGLLDPGLPKNWLPKNWEEISRTGSNTQIVINLGHIDPENQANSILVSGQTTANVDGETVSVHGIAPKGTMTKFFDSMTKMAATGWMEGYTPEKISSIRKDFNTKIMNEKYDTSVMVSITRFDSVGSAKDALENQMTLPTQGFGALKIPGADGKVTNYFDNEYVKQYISEDQRKLLSEMMKKASEEYKVKTKAHNMNFYKDTVCGYPAVLSEIDNPEYLRQEEAKKRPKPTVDKNKFQGGGFDPLAGKGVLPKKSKPLPPEKTIKGCVAIQAGQYLITGTLLSMLFMTPRGDTFHESLKKTDKYIEREKVEGQMYTTTHVIPVESNIAEEGYVYREQIEKIVSIIIDSVKGKN